VVHHIVGEEGYGKHDILSVETCKQAGAFSYFMSFIFNPDRNTEFGKLSVYSFD